jgi:hypothetical protein
MGRLQQAKSADGAKLRSRKMPREGVDMVEDVIARTTSRTFTWDCIDPADPMRISVFAP